MTFDKAYAEMLKDENMGKIQYRRAQFQQIWNEAINSAQSLVEKRGQLIGGAINPERTIDDLETLKEGA